VIIITQRLIIYPFIVNTPITYNVLEANLTSQRVVLTAGALVVSTYHTTTCLKSKEYFRFVQTLNIEPVAHRLNPIPLPTSHRLALLFLGNNYCALTTAQVGIKNVRVAQFKHHYTI
jgi:hypothetical protein